MNNKSRSITSWVLAAIVALIFIGSGLFKLSGAEATSVMAREVGGKGNLVILGIAELIIAGLFLIPRTGVAGTLLMIAYMGGAMAAHFTNNQPIIVIVILEIIIWIVGAIRFPELSQRLFNSRTKY